MFAIVLRRCLPVMVLILVTSSSFVVQAQVNPRLVREIRHELATLPYYGVFDSRCTAKSTDKALRSFDTRLRQCRRFTLSWTAAMRL